MRLPAIQQARTHPSQTGFPCGGPSCRGLLPPMLEASPQRSAGAPDGHSHGGRMNTGWEVRPLGWVLLALIVGVVLYYAAIKLTRPPQDDHPTH
jgi:hypothetical protein